MGFLCSPHKFHNSMHPLRANDHLPWMDPTDDDDKFKNHFFFQTLIIFSQIVSLFYLHIAKII